MRTRRGTGTPRICQDRQMPNPHGASTPIIKASVPALSPKTWYGMPAYATGCLFLPKRAEVQSQVRDVRLQRTGRNLDEGAMWPTAFALRCRRRGRHRCVVKKAVSRGLSSPEKSKD